MKPASFDYQAAESIDEAVSLLAKPGSDVKILAGGQSLLPLLNMRLAFPDLVVDINRISGLDYITSDDGSVRVGALARQSSFGESPLVRTRVPLAARCVRHIGHFVTRNRGTVAGSLAHADSKGELPVVLTALGGSVVAVSGRGQREIAASDLFVSDFTTSLGADELVTESIWPVLGEDWGFGFEELAIRHGDYALGMVAAAVRATDGEVSEARLVAGSVADRPVILEEAASALLGGQADSRLLQEVSDLAMTEVEPTGDIHAPGDYRRHLVGVLVGRAVRNAWEEILNG